MEHDVTVALLQLQQNWASALYLKASVVYSFQSWTGEYSMSENCVDFRGPRLEQLVGGHHNGAAGVRHVVHQDGHPVLQVVVRSVCREREQLLLPWHRPPAPFCPPHLPFSSLCESERTPRSVCQL